MQKSLEIAISTYNRASILKEWININFTQLSRLGISLAIYDSSTNDETMNLINSFNTGNLSNKIRYIRKDSSMRVDDKVLQSIMNSSADYVWPLGDSTCINFDDILTKIFPFLNEGYDFVCLFGNSKINNDGKIYNSPLDFFGECFWHATWLGGIIFDRNIFAPLLIEEKYDYFRKKYNRNDGFSYLGIFYELIANKQINAVFRIIRTDGTIGKNKVQGRLKRYMDVWCDNLIYFVDSLPDYYNPQKDKVLKETWKILDLDGIWSYKARKCGALSKEIFNRYDRLGYLDRVLDNKTRIKRFATLPDSLVKPYYLIIKIQNKISKVCGFK